MNGEEEERVERILEKLSEIEPAINTVKKLQQSGLLAVLDAIAEQSDNIFNYASTMGILDAASAMARIAPLVSDIMGNVDVEALEGKLRSVPWKTLFSALLALLDFIATDLPKIRAPQGKVTTLQILSEMRSPGMEYFLRIAESLSTKVMKEMGEKDSK
ncbi:hypothetical protein GCM10007108_13120 [Thermogymnomonas acidicola]|uniref:DUF1641 domain-containing protein n=1 Tax=Thermogymnomonas acidicola TaxID=399579 RepID=A0AA37BSG1_9ARCH|nr:hypothetical protein [Thermogymnomonas acidicola]GGM76472.1 hypothetical protein GCM10007108_13120 [Thermogymnomonas acidicola]